MATDDYKTAFDGIDIALLIGSRPRGPGMLRADLLKANSKIFEGQGKALQKWAKESVKVLVVGNPANTNALICASNAPRIPKTSFTCLTRLDQNRAKHQLAKQLDVPVYAIRKVAIWGNHSKTQYPDCTHVEVEDGNGDFSTPDLDEKWIAEEFIPTVQQRGAAIIAARKLSSAASAANAILNHVHDWVLGTPEGDWSSMGILSDGTMYDIPEGLVCSLPCICRDGEIHPVQGLTLDKTSKERIAITVKELQQEKATVSKS